MAGEVCRLERDLQYVAAVLEEGPDLEDLGRRVDVDAAQDEFGVRQRLPYRLPELRLVHAELSDRPAHAHPRAH